MRIVVSLLGALFVPVYVSARPPAVFGSYHPGICQFAFCDGSVHALPVTINLVTLGRLAARNDGEPIPEY